MNWSEIFTKKKMPDGEASAAVPSDIAPEGSVIVENTADVSDGGVGLQTSDPGTGSQPDATGNKTIPGEPLCDLAVRMRIDNMGNVAKAALYLALSSGIGEERRIKEALNGCGWRGVATEVGGISGELPMKASRALVGAALNSGVVRKNTSEMHALMHAAQEAFNTFIPDGLLEMSVGAKIAIVRNSQWLAVAVAGDTAFHAIAHHERVGVGVMHI